MPSVDALKCQGKILYGFDCCYQQDFIKSALKHKDIKEIERHTNYTLADIQSFYL